MSVSVRIDECNGCADCVPSCPYGAISMEGGSAVVSAECTMCGACVEVCPQNAIEMPQSEPADSDTASGHGIWVFAEQRNGEIASVVYELLEAGRKLADKIGEELGAVLLGKGIAGAADKLIGCGADKVFLLDDTQFEYYRDDHFTAAIAALVRAYRPNIFLFGATTNGRSLAPRLAARLQTGLTADCTELDIDVDRKLLLQTRPALGGNIMATIICQYRRPQMATVRPKVFPRAEYDPGRKGEVVAPEIALTDVDTRVNIVGAVTEASDAMRLDEADIVVAGGRGLGSAENYRLVEELAALLGGATAASRAIVDEGWAPYASQVGQTGKTITPKLYIACGISGAVQHLIGMRSAATIVAINKNPEAPIFSVAHYGIVGDVVEVLTEMIKTLKKLK